MQSTKKVLGRLGQRVNQQQHSTNNHNNSDSSAAIAVGTAIVATAAGLGYCYDSSRRAKSNPALWFTDPTAHKAAKIWDNLTSPLMNDGPK